MNIHQRSKYTTSLWIPRPRWKERE